MNIKQILFSITLIGCMVNNAVAMEQENLQNSPVLFREGLDTIIKGKTIRDRIKNPSHKFSKTIILNVESSTDPKTGTIFNFQGTLKDLAEHRYLSDIKTLEQHLSSKNAFYCPCVTEYVFVNGQSKLITHNVGAIVHSTQTLVNNDPNICEKLNNKYEEFMMKLRQKNQD